MGNWNQISFSKITFINLSKKTKKHSQNWQLENEALAFWLLFPIFKKVILKSIHISRFWVVTLHWHLRSPKEDSQTHEWDKKPPEQSELGPQRTLSSTGVRGERRKRGKRGIWWNQNQDWFTHLYTQLSQFRSLLNFCRTSRWEEKNELSELEKKNSTSSWRLRWSYHSTKTTIKTRRKFKEMSDIFQRILNASVSIKRFFSLQHFVYGITMCH